MTFSVGRRGRCTGGRPQRTMRHPALPQRRVCPALGRAGYWGAPTAQPSAGCAVGNPQTPFLLKSRPLIPNCFDLDRLLWILIFPPSIKRLLATNFIHSFTFILISTSKTLQLSLTSFSPSTSSPSSNCVIFLNSW